MEDVSWVGLQPVPGGDSRLLLCDDLFLVKRPGFTIMKKARRSLFVEGKRRLRKCLVGKEIRRFGDGLELTGPTINLFI